MASEILRLFTSPEDYQMRQQQLAQDRALQFAQLNPFEKASYGIYQGAGQLAGAGAQLFGMQDPQLRMISQRQALSQGLDLSDPESIMQAAQKAAQLGDQQFAFSLAEIGRKAQGDLALVQQRTKEGKAAATPQALQIAGAKAELIDRIDQIKQLPDSPEKTRALNIAQNTLDNLQTVARQGQIPDSIEIARELALEAGPEGSEAYKTKYRTELRTLTEKKNTDKQLEQARLLVEAGYAPGTPEYIAKMRQFVEAEITGTGKGKGTTDIKLTLPGQTKEGVKGVSEFRKSVIDTIKPFRDTLTSADQAIQSINDSLKTGNFISFNAARTQLAKSLGDGTLSRRDVEQAGGDPSILGGLADAASTMFTGTPTADTQRKIKSTLTAIRKVAREKGQNELAVQKQIAQQSGYNEDQMKLIFNVPEFEVKGKTTPEARRTDETIPDNVASRITQVAPPAPAPAPAAKPPAKGQKQTRRLKSGKTVIEETE